MKNFFQHPVTLVSLAFALLIAAWSVIVTTAVRHRAQSIPVQAESQQEQQP